RAVAPRQRRAYVEVSGFFGSPNQLVDSNFAEYVARPLGFPDIALNEPPVSATDGGNRLAVHEMNYRIRVQTRVRLTPPQHRNVKHSLLSRPPRPSCPSCLAVLNKLQPSWSPQTHGMDARR